MGGHAHWRGVDQAIGKGQGSGRVANGKGAPFSEEEFLTLLGLAKAGCSELVALQKQAIA